MDSQDLAKMLRAAAEEVGVLAPEEVSCWLVSALRAAADTVPPELVWYPSTPPLKIEDFAHSPDATKWDWRESRPRTCFRSHPHESMDAECQFLSEKARADNAEINLASVREKNHAQTKMLMSKDAEIKRLKSDIEEAKKRGAVAQARKTVAFIRASADDCPNTEASQHAAWKLRRCADAIEHGMLKP